MPSAGGELLALYREVALDLQMNDRYVSLVEEGFEFAVRIGHLDDTTLRARRIGQFESVCVASEQYMALRGCPEKPEDLRDHDCVIYTLLLSGGSWRFRTGDVPVSGRIRVSSPEAAREMVLAGLGVGYGPQWLFEAGLKEGSLRLILRDHVPPPVPINILYAANRLMPARVRVFMDFITQKFLLLPAFNR